jgi:hypothetical protein
MPGLVPGIHVLAAEKQEDVDGRDKPGHDELASAQPILLRIAPEITSLSLTVINGHSGIKWH